MKAILYSGPIAAITAEQLLGEKRRCAKFYINISKPEPVPFLFNM